MKVRVRAHWGIAALALAAVLVCSVVQAQSRSRLELQFSQGIGTAGAPAAAAPQVGQASSTSEPIAAGDAVSVTVYQEPDLGVAAQKVRADGTISLPLLGELHVTGLSSKQLQLLITERLGDGYLKQPSVTVNVDRYRVYFIKGEVASPGGYTYVDGLTLEKAIALAGGYTERASKRALTVVRESAPDRPLKGAPPSTPVMPGDVITVEESFF